MINFFKSLAVTLGFLLFFKSLYSLVRSFIEISNPIRVEFWDSYLVFFKSFSIFWIIIGVPIFFGVYYFYSKNTNNMIN